MVASGTQTLGLRPLGRGHTVSCSGFSSPFFAPLYEREPVSQRFLGFLNPPRNCSNLEGVSFNWQYSWLGVQANYITLWLLWFDLFLKFISIAQLQTVQFSSVTQSYLTLCDPMNRSTPGLPVHHQLLEFTQTHAHRVSNAIQPSHPLLSPSPPAPNPSQHQGLFQ